MRKATLAVMVLIAVFVLSGCVARTYNLTRDRVDQDLSEGNKGYLKGSAPAGSEKERSTTRTTKVLEIEFGPKAKTQKKASPAQPVAEPSEGNRGYITESAPAETVSPTVSEPTFEKYTVARGDTLQKISQKFYGTSKKWKKIYNANKDTLKAPDKIFPGKILNIPVEAKSESVKETQENLK